MISLSVRIKYQDAITSPFDITTKNHHYNDEENTDCPNRAIREEMDLKQSKNDG